MTAADDKFENPYPGLRPFNADETHLFFGRDTQTAELLRRLQQSRFLAIVGTSGSGKSSLVRAGMLQGLHGGLMAGGSQWRVVDLRPGTDPLGNLAAALDRPGALRDDGCSAEDSFTDATLRRSGRGLVQAVREARLAPRERVLVLVDQFEELFRAIDADANRHLDDDAVAFVELLLCAARQNEVPIYVALTMRSDFLGECARFRDLPEAISDGQYLIPRLTRDQLREAMAGPAAVHGISLTDRLVDRLLDDLGGNPDQLPILQHALMRTWDLWLHSPQRGESIDLPDYERIGGMAHALSRHADEVLDSLGDGVAGRGVPPQRIAECLFKALATIGSSGQEVRRFASVQSVADIAGVPPDAVSAVIEAFRAPGNSFLMPPVGEPLSADTVIDISHESLIRNWTTVRGWLAEEAESARSYARLATTAALHARGEAGLLPGPDLSRALAWRLKQRPTTAWAQRYDGDYVQAMNFLDDSEAAAELTKQAQAGRSRTFKAAVAVGVVAFLAMATSWVSEASNQRATLEWRTDAAQKRLDLAKEMAALQKKDQRDEERCKTSRAEPGIDDASIDDVSIDYGAEHSKHVIHWLCEPNKSEAIEWLEPFFTFTGELEKGQFEQAREHIDRMWDGIRTSARILLDAAESVQRGRLTGSQQALALRQQAMVDQMAEVFFAYRQTGQLDVARCAEFRREMDSEPGWTHLNEIAGWLCNNEAEDERKQLQFFEINELVLSGDVEAAHTRLDQHLPDGQDESFGFLREAVLASLDAVPELQAPRFQTERRELVKLEKAKKARELRKANAPPDQPAPVRTALEFKHPLYSVIAAKLRSDTAKLTEAEEWLLAAYGKVEQDPKYRRLLAQNFFYSNDEMPDPVPPKSVPDTFVKMAVNAASHESAGSALADRALLYGPSFLIVLSWPIWWVWRRWQQRQGQPIAQKPGSLRRALAAVVDLGIAFGAMGATTLAILYLATEFQVFLLAFSVGFGYLLFGDALRLRYCRSLGKIAFDLRPVHDDAGGQTGRITLLASAKRFAADTLLPALLLLLLLLLVLLLAVGGVSSGLEDDDELLELLPAYAMFALLAAYWLSLALMRDGRTWGDRWSRTRVIDADSDASRRVDAPPRYLEAKPAPGATSP